MYDVVIIGAGVSGSACARELSRYNLSICVVEKEEDVCCGTSKANSAIVHSGIDCKPGTLMAEMNVRGNELMEPLSKELDFEFRRNGSLIVCFSEEDRPKLEALYEQGIANKIPDIRILDAHEVHEMEPNLSEEVVAAIYCPTGGIVCPFGLNIALAENAATNGVEFRFNTEVTDICRKDDGYQLSTNRGYILTRCVVNAAGVYADVFHNMVSSKKIHITPRRGAPHDHHGPAGRLLPACPHGGAACAAHGIPAAGQIRQGHSCNPDGSRQYADRPYRRRSRR